MNRMLRGMSFTIVSALLFGVTPILASMTFEMGSNANTLTFYRNLMVVPVLLCVMLVKKIPFRVSLREVGFLLLVGVVFRASTTYMLYESYNYVGVGTATTLHFLYPVVTALICRIIFRERLDRLQWAAVALAAIGVAIVVAGFGRVPWLAIVAGITFPAYSAVKKSVECDGIVSVFCETMWMLIPALVSK